MKSVSIDPSVNFVGWSSFNSRAKSRSKAWKWGTIRPEGVNLEMRIMNLIEELAPIMEDADFFITERPAFYSSERGMIAAHQNYTIDLAAVAYFVAGWFHMDHRKHFAITAPQWKGSVPKAVTARRFFRDFPNVKEATLSEHAIDAVMLHRWWIENVAMVTPRVVRLGSLESFQLLI